MVACLVACSANERLRSHVSGDGDVDIELDPPIRSSENS